MGENSTYRVTIFDDNWKRLNSKYISVPTIYEAVKQTEEMCSKFKTKHYDIRKSNKFGSKVKVS